MATLTVLYGPPGAGKSTYAATFDTVVVSLDMLTTPTDVKLGYASLETWTYTKNLIRESLYRNEDVVLDGFAPDPIVRMELRVLAQSLGATIRLVILDAPLSTCLERNSHRQHRLADTMLTHLYSLYLTDRSRCLAEQWSTVTRVVDSSPQSLPAA